MNHPIRCSCGLLRGIVSHTEAVANRCVCYCKDCQAFARFLKRDGEILDALGGTDIVQTLPKYVRFAEGAENLACMRLTDHGLLRWYASCCNTPIGNTLPNFKASFVGLIHTCLEAGEGSLERSFGPIRTRVHTKSAKGAAKPASTGLAASIWRIGGMMLRARLDGSYRETPFFAAATACPVATPQVLTAQQFKELMNAE